MRRGGCGRYWEVRLGDEGLLDLWATLDERGEICDGLPLELGPHGKHHQTLVSILSPTPRVMASETRTIALPSISEVPSFPPLSQCRARLQ